MTAKQKQNIARFKRVVAEAKKLRKKNPGLTQPQAVKQAWAILYKSGKKVGATKIIEKGEKKNAKVTKVLQRIRTKKGTFKGTKRVGNANNQYQLIREKDGFYLTYNLSSGKHYFVDSKDWGVLMTKTQAEQMKKKYENEGVNVRIVEYTKNPLKRVSGSSHKDTKSHNVNIRVVSGMPKGIVKKIDQIIDEIKQREDVIQDVKQRKKQLIAKNGNQWYIKWMKDAKKIVSELKHHKTQLKKYI